MEDRKKLIKTIERMTPQNYEKVINKIAKAGFLNDDDKETFLENLSQDMIYFSFVHDQLEQRIWYPEAKEIGGRIE